ncbi:hypothetical protein ACHAXT_008467 [Thalassiosira profunda]
MPRRLVSVLTCMLTAAAASAAATSNDASAAREARRELQNMCPVSHSLLSQGLVEINTFGNVFSITTPEDDGGTADGSVETISITTLSLRMADWVPDGDHRFEVWLYTGDGLSRNANDLDEDPSNDNEVVPSSGDYTKSRAKIGAWELISEGKEGDLIPDTEYYDNSGHFFDLGTSNAGLPVGPLGTLDQFDNMQEVTIAAQEWNDNRINPDGGMEVITSEGETTQTYFYKIPEEMFTKLQLPKSNGKLSLFVTLDRVGMQSGYAKDEEFNTVDVAKHDYIDQTPSVDGLNGNINLQTRVGESSIFYPWLEEEFFYVTRRFLGKVWYEAEIPCEYTATPTGEPTGSNVPTPATAAPNSSTNTVQPSPQPSSQSSDQPTLSPASQSSWQPTLRPSSSSSGQQSPMPSSQSAQATLQPINPNVEGAQGASGSSFSASQAVRIVCGGAAFALLI